MKRSLTIWLLFILGGCDSSVYNFTFNDIDGNVVKQPAIAEDEFVLYFFLSPQCPLSENYSKTINEITAGLDSTTDKIHPFVVVTGDRYSTDEIRSFIQSFHIYPKVLLDPKNQLAKKLNATITPEVFLLNAKQEIKYEGAIDNWAVDLGQKRQVITEHYLLDAIDAVLNGREVSVSKTQAVGCYIEFN